MGEYEKEEKIENESEGTGEAGKRNKVKVG